MPGLKRRYYPFLSDDGFTVIETLVYGIALSVVGLACAVLLVGIVRSTSRTQQSAHDAALASVVDREIRRAVESVAPPFWARSFEPVFGEQAFVARYYGGIGHCELSIAGSPSGLIISAAEDVKTLADVSLESVSPIGTSRGVVGLNIRYSIGTETYETKALFSSFPLGAGDGS